MHLCILSIYPCKLKCKYDFLARDFSLFQMKMERKRRWLPRPFVSQNCQFGYRTWEMWKWWWGTCTHFKWSDCGNEIILVFTWWVKSEQMIWNLTEKVLYRKVLVIAWPSWSTSAGMCLGLGHWQPFSNWSPIKNTYSQKALLSVLSKGATFFAITSNHN